MLFHNSLHHRLPRSAASSLRRRRLLTLAALTLPSSAFATIYNLSNQTLNLATSTYTSSDTLNCTQVTFTSSITSTFPATLNFLGAANLLTNTAPVTFTGPLTGTGSFTKSGTGSLTLTSPSPSFTGPVTINSGATLFLADPKALGPSTASTPITFAGTLDTTGSLPARTLYLNSGAILANNNILTPTTIGPSLSLAPNVSFFTLAATGDMFYSSPLSIADRLTKTGTGILTYSTPTTFYSGITVSAGTLRLGIESPFTKSSYPPIDINVNSTATFDLNGFNSPGTGTSVLLGGSIVNNTSTPSTFSNSFNSTTATASIGGSGNINLTAPVISSFTKIGTGTLTLSAANTGVTISPTITLSAGTIRVNHTGISGIYKLNSGILDLNGFPATNSSYTYAGGGLENDNASTPSTLDFTKASFHATTSVSGGTTTVYGITFGGPGDIITTGFFNSTIDKYGTGTLELQTMPGQSFISEGIVRISTANSESGGFMIYGSSPSYPTFHYGALDLNGFSPSFFSSITVTNNAGIINNNVSSPSTFLGTLTTASFLPTPSELIFGGNGTLNLGYSTVSNVKIYKVGTGLLTLGSGYFSAGAILNAGTLQVETNLQLGYPYFYGGTLRIAPLYLPDSNSYTFTGAVYVDPSSSSSTIDTQRNTTLTNTLTGTGTLTKTGTGSLTLTADSLSNSPSLNITQGTLSLSSGSTTGTLSSPISLSPNTTLTFNHSNSLTFSPPITGSGSLIKLGAGTLTLFSTPGPLALSIQTGSLTLAPSLPTTPHLQSLTLSATGSLNLTNNSLLIDTTSPDTLRQYLHTTHLYSSADTTHTLAYLTTGNTTLIELTLQGDANLDAQINADDYILLDRSFAKSLSNAHWTDGDFNYDGIINTQDYLLLDTSFGKAQGFSPGFLSLRESQFGQAYVTNLISSVPEPSLLACLIALPLLPRHRRS